MLLVVAITSVGKSLSTLRKRGEQEPKPASVDFMLHWRDWFRLGTNGGQMKRRQTTRVPLWQAGWISIPRSEPSRMEVDPGANAGARYRSPSHLEPDQALIQETEIRVRGKRIEGRKVGYANRAWNGSAE